MIFSIGAALLSTPAEATEPLRLYAIDSGDLHQVTYADCPEEECSRVTLGCEGDLGSFGLSHAAGLAVRLIESNDRSGLSLSFTVGRVALVAEVVRLIVEPNRVAGGWSVHFPSYDMGPVFASIAQQPDATIVVSVAGESFDLTPSAEDRAILHQLTQDCA